MEKERVLCVFAATGVADDSVLGVMRSLMLQVLEIGTVGILQACTKAAGCKLPVEKTSPLVSEVLSVFRTTSPPYDCWRAASARLSLGMTSSIKMGEIRTADLHSMIVGGAKIVLRSEPGPAAEDSVDLFEKRAFSSFFAIIAHRVGSKRRPSSSEKGDPAKRVKRAPLDMGVKAASPAFDPNRAIVARKAEGAPAGGSHPGWNDNFLKKHNMKHWRGKANPVALTRKFYFEGQQKETKHEEEQLKTYIEKQWKNAHGIITETMKEAPKKIKLENGDKIEKFTRRRKPETKEILEKKGKK